LQIIIPQIISHSYFQLKNGVAQITTLPPNLLGAVMK
jgi:hypothetical protein